MQEEVLVVGGGAMGTGIAVVAARGGYAVTVVEPDAGSRERGSARATKDGVNFTWADAIPQRSSATIAIEAVPERYDIKREVFVKLNAALDPTAIIATNTSSLSVSELADMVDRPERVIGLHFFNPAQKMQLVEIVERAEVNTNEVIARAREFVERIGKTGAICADTPGFIVNRVARPYYLQSLRAYERGVASIPELDALARAAGFRMGPFELMDLVGLDINLATSESVYDRLGEPARLEPRPEQRALVAQGRLGRKAGSGFYDYSAGDPERIDLRADPIEDDVQIDEVVAIIGYGGNAEKMVELLGKHVASVQQIEYDDAIGSIKPETTVVIDLGEGVEERTELILELDRSLDDHAVIFVDAYANDLNSLAHQMRHPERLVGYGLLGALESQHAVEIVDTEAVSDDALELAQELFDLMGKGVMLVENLPGLYLGRVIGSIVNEAIVAVHEGVATSDDVDTAMKLGVNYPAGPIEWGREIGGARVAAILRRLAEAEGEAFAPHRALWVLDTDQGEDYTKVEPQDFTVAE